MFPVQCNKPRTVYHSRVIITSYQPCSPVAALICEVMACTLFPLGMRVWNTSAWSQGLFRCRGETYGCEMQMPVGGFVSCQHILDFKLDRTLFLVVNNVLFVCSCDTVVYICDINFWKLLQVLIPILTNLYIFYLLSQKWWKLIPIATLCSLDNVLQSNKYNNKVQITYNLVTL